MIERASSLADSAQRRHGARALARLFDARGEAGIADQLAGMGKADDVADLGGDHESEHAADTGEWCQHEQRRSAIYLVRDGRVASDEFYVTRDEALEAAGLSD